MMIKLVFFASLREQLGRERVDVDYCSGIETVADVVDAAINEHPDLQAMVPQQKKLMVAINQDMASWTASVKDGDEIALLPPVTGG